MEKYSNIDIFCIYPEDKTTSFLRRIVNYLKLKIGDKFYCFKVKLNDISHENCLDIVNQLSDKIILFLGHGRSSRLHGAAAKYDDEDLIDDRILEDSSDDFNKPDFITSENASFFSNHIVFSLSCNSNKIKDTNSIARSIIDNNAKAFIGFGDIPTDWELDIKISKREIAIFKGLLVKIIKKSIVYSYKNNFSIEKLVYIINLFTNIEIVKLARYKKYKRLNNIIKILYDFKSGITILGDKYIPLICAH